LFYVTCNLPDEAATVFARYHEGFNHFSLVEVAAVIVELMEPEVEAAQIVIGALHQDYDAPGAGLNFDGYNFWLAKLNQFNGDFVAAEMVKAFIVSGEYRQKFAP
jgi:hypothetical protein